MYEHNANQMILPHEFFLPFGGHLNLDNRWVRMASIIPWADLEHAYLESLGDLTQGSKAYNVQLALGALIIKERLGLSDEETVEAITQKTPICNISSVCLHFSRHRRFTHPCLLALFLLSYHTLKDRLDNMKLGRVAFLYSELSDL